MKKSHSLPGADEYFAEKYKHLPRNSAIGQLPDAENAAKRIKTSFKLISRDELVHDKEEETAPPIIQEPKDEEDEGAKAAGGAAAVVLIEDTDDEKDDDDDEVPLTQPKPSETVWPSSETFGFNEVKASVAVASAEKRLKEEREEADKENEKEQEEQDEDLFEDMD